MVEAAWVLAIVVELGGGLLIHFGLFTRLAGLSLAVRVFIFPSQRSST